MDISNILSVLVDGLSLGAIYALIALGYTMVYGIAKMLNFAHGDVIMVGAYVCFFACSRFSLPPLVGVLLALALEPVPHILILDEPLSGVDIEGEHQLLEMLDELRTEYDLSILLSTHDFATLNQFADKVILLNKRILKVGPPDEVTASPEFYETFHLRMGKGGM